MENDIVYYHKELQKNIRAVERDETDQYALNAVKENFLKLRITSSKHNSL